MHERFTCVNNWQSKQDLVPKTRLASERPPSTLWVSARLYPLSWDKSDSGDGPEDAFLIWVLRAMAFLRACSAQKVTLKKRKGHGKRNVRDLQLIIKLRWNKEFKEKHFPLPIFSLNFRCGIGAALAVLGRHVAALLVRGSLILQNVLDAKVQAVKPGLRARPLGKGARLGLLRTTCLGHPVATRRQNVNSYSVHCKPAKKKKSKHWFWFLKCNA